MTDEIEKKLKVKESKNEDVDNVTPVATTPQVSKPQASISSTIIQEEIKPTLEDDDDDEFAFVPSYDSLIAKQKNKTAKPSKNEQEKLVDAVSNAPRIRYEQELTNAARTMMEAHFTKALEISESDKLKVLSMKDFTNKKQGVVDRRRQVKLPLPNSHFNVTVRGFGAFDFANLYGQDPDAYNQQYEKDLYKAQVGAITGTEPMIPSQELSQFLHYNDMDAITLGILIGTHKKVYYLHHCENQDCPSPDFTAESKPIDMLLNYDEIETWIEENERNTVFEDVISKSRLIEVPINVLKDDGLIFYYKELSISEYTKFTKKFEVFVSTKKTDRDKQKLQQIAPILAFISKIEDYVINGVATDFDTKMAILDQLDDEQLDMLSKEYQDRIEDIKKYKIGFKNIECPTCGHNHSEILIPSAQALAFSHLLVSGILKQKKTQEK